MTICAEKWRKAIFHYYYIHLINWLQRFYRGTRMIASSSTFRPHPGRVLRDLFRQLHAVWHGLKH